MRINEPISNVLICPFCQHKLNMSGVFNCPKCGNPLSVRVSIDSVGTAIVPNRPMNYIQNPQKDND